MGDKYKLRFQEYIARDEFDDTAKYAGLKMPYYGDAELQFVLRNAEVAKQRPNSQINFRWLDVGIGSGSALDFFPITHAIEPSAYRRARLDERIKARDLNVLVRDLCVENLDELDAPLMDVVTYIRGFAQCRSEWEALWAIHDSLAVTGVFIVNVLDQSEDPIHGRSHTNDALVSFIESTGFRLIERRVIAQPVIGRKWLWLAFSHGEYQTAEKFNHLQIVPQGDGTSIVHNKPSGLSLA